MISPGDSAATAIAILPGTEDAYVVGWSESEAFPTTSTALQSYAQTSFLFTAKRSAFFMVLDTYSVGDQNAPGESSLAGGLKAIGDSFAGNVNEDSVLYSTYISSNCADEADAVAVDRNGEALVAGQTAATQLDEVTSEMCGAIPTLDNSMLTQGNGFLYRFSRPDHATASTMLAMTYLNDKAVAVAVRDNKRGVDVIETGSDHLTLEQLAFPSGHFADDSITSLGWGSRAAMTTVMANGVYPPVSQILFYNYSPSAAVVQQLDVASGTLQEIYRFDQGTAAAVAASAHSVIVGLDTTVTTLPTAGRSGNGHGDGYVARIPWDSDPMNSGPNVVFVNVPSDIVAQAASPQGNAISFKVSADYWLDGSHPKVDCTADSGQTFPIGTSIVHCSVNTAPLISDVIVYDNSFRITVTATPVIKVPASITAEAAGSSGAYITWPLVTGQDIFGIVYPTCDHQNGSWFAIGTTTVLCTVQHPYISPGGEEIVFSAAERFLVTVQDTTAPNFVTDVHINTFTAR